MAVGVAMSMAVTGCVTMCDCHHINEAVPLTVTAGVCLACGDVSGCACGHDLGT